MEKWLLWVVFGLALLSRVVSLSSLPAGFTPDEASFGYDAYSLLKTGKDQWGHSFPLVLESFGDFKPPLYAYLTVPFVALFGLSEWVVRFPNALLGSLAVVVTYYLVIETGKFERSQNLKRKRNGLGINSRYLALTASLLLAISPWHIMMSRGAFEANLTTFLMPLGILAFMKGLPVAKKKLKNSKWMCVSSFAFGLNLFSYHSARLVTLLLIPVLIVIFHKEFVYSTSKDRARVYKRALAIIGIFIALAAFTFLRGAGARVKDISIFRGALEEAAGPRLEAVKNGISPALAHLLHNKYQVALARFVNNYQQYFSYRFLFTHGPAEATYGMIPGRGVLQWFSLPLFLGFIISFIKNRKSRLHLLFLFWLLLGPVPAALATGRGYAGNRAVIMLPAFQVVLSIGAVYLYKLMRGRFSNLSPKLVIGLFLLIIIFSTNQFIRDYFVDSPKLTAASMLYGRREMAEYLSSVDDSYDHIVVSRTLSEPQIYIAFFNKWEPAELQEESKDWGRYRKEELKFLDQLGQYRLGKYVFTRIESIDELGIKGSYLMAGQPGEFANGVQPVEVINLPNGGPAVYIVDPNTEYYAKSI